MHVERVFKITLHGADGKLRRRDDTTTRRDRGSY
jgi:hypothetical protein